MTTVLTSKHGAFWEGKKIVVFLHQLQSQGARAELGGQDGQQQAYSRDMKILCYISPNFMLLKIQKVQDWINEG